MGGSDTNNETPRTRVSAIQFRLVDEDEHADVVVPECALVKGNDLRTRKLQEITGPATV